MAKFRKKPIVIEAKQWFPGKRVKGVRELVMASTTDPRGYTSIGIIKTLEGTMKVSPGDWIITGVKGEKYPCKPDIFDATYELVGEENNG